MNTYIQQRFNIIPRSTMILWLIIVGTIYSGASHSFAMGELRPVETVSQNTYSPQRILLAARSIDTAWEEFHRSAIGGTLASPTLQTQIEQQLHDARGLLMKARKANRKGDHRSVVGITDQVLALSKTIISSSREKKQ